MESYTKNLVIQTTPDTLYRAITTQEGLSSWWTNECEVEGFEGGKATFHFDKTYATFSLEKLVPNTEVEWKCVDQYFEIDNSDETDEWYGTKINFKIQDNTDGSSTLFFEHVGLTPFLDCYTVCRDGWDYFLQSLKDYVETGKGSPYIRGQSLVQNL